jgi:hypothetical protein
MPRIDLGEVPGFGVSAWCLGGWMSRVDLEEVPGIGASAWRLNKCLAPFRGVLLGLYRQPLASN